MERRRVVGIELRLLELLEQVELRDQRGSAAHWRGRGVHGGSAIRRRYGLAIGGEVARQVRQTHGTSLPAQVADQALGNRPPIESVGAGARDLFERPRQVGIANRVASDARYAP